MENVIVIVYKKICNHNLFIHIWREEKRGTYIMACQIMWQNLLFSHTCHDTIN